MISVVIPTQNRKHALLRSLQSVYNQTKLPGEIIVIDDGSESPVPEAVFSACPFSVKCILLRNETARGANESRNLGILKSSGEYIALLDDDDCFCPEKIAKLSAAIKFNPMADVFYHQARIYMPQEGLQYVLKQTLNRAGEDIFRSLLIENRIGGSSMVVVRRDALLEVGLFDNMLPALQDYELWLRLAMFKKTFFFIDEPLTAYFHDSTVNSISKSVPKKLEAFDYIFQKYKFAYSELSEKEKNKSLARVKKEIVRTHVLNGDWRGSIRSQFNFLLTQTTVRNFFILLVVLAGPDVTRKARAWFS